MKPVMAPVFMGSTLLEGQYTTQQYSNYQQTQQIPVHSAVTAAGSRLLTNVVALQPNIHLQGASTVSSAPIDGRSEYSCKHYLKLRNSPLFAVTKQHMFHYSTVNQHVGGMTSPGATTTGGVYYTSSPQISGITIKYYILATFTAEPCFQASPLLH